MLAPDMARVDISGQRFGRWTVQKPLQRNKHRTWDWLCRCECGTEASVSGVTLRAGKSQSCGCVHKGKGTTHGQTGTPLHKRWHQFRARCNNPNLKRWKDYGGRGITYAAEWDDFPTFAKWAEESGFRKDLQLDRIDNDGPYAPWNCRWVDRITNANNRSDNQIFDFFGEIMSVSQAARKFGIATSTLFSRLLLYGYSPEEAVTVPTNVAAAKQYRKDRGNCKTPPQILGADL